MSCIASIRDWKTPASAASSRRPTHPHRSPHTPRSRPPDIGRATMSIAGLELVVRPPRGRFGWWGIAAVPLVAAVALWWTAVGAQINGQNLLNGVPYMADFLARMFPPNWAFAEKLVKPAVESLQVAVWG